MGVSALWLILSCPDTKVINSSNDPWNDYDVQTLERAKRRCVELWPDAPCLTYLEKYGIKSYRAACGEKR